MRYDRSTAEYHFPVKLIKKVATDLDSYLTHIIDTFMETSAVLFLWKIAEIPPVPKAEQPIVESNHLPFFLSKIFERLVLKQLATFSEEASLFGPCIAGFR